MSKRDLTVQDFTDFLHSQDISVKRNVFTGNIECEGRFGVEEENHKISGEVLCYGLNRFSINYKFKYSLKYALELIIKVSKPYNPVQEMLSVTQWDGKERISVLYDILGLTENIDKVILKKWLHQCLSMALNDNCECCNNIVLLICDYHKKTYNCASIFYSFLSRFDETINLFTREATPIGCNATTTRILYTLQEYYTKSWITMIRYFQESRGLFLRHFVRTAKGTSARYSDAWRKYYYEVPLRTSFCGSFDTDDFWKCEINNINFHSIAHSCDKKLLESLSYDWVKQLWAEVYQTMYLTFGTHGYELTQDEIKESQDLQNSLKGKNLWYL
ncbi:MAG: hypothetical protein IJQ99_03885 [Synergistaceae bacterium]|nr:hypothetical protein [Synergistaceae bacterium]